ncbi:glucodextranase DOMON-like domain-containing protein [Archangium violaceum]|uniref:Glucodextranase-like C-terminal domain-containing protein n=1 Tax=Archangium violaceum Cb vi76 TaxID=1406225 RepID=A0A084SFQ2_9BACT|nr:glucodextranase DOMON-like domain-containing protein [Archangium violaceum]KFA87287.1 hypothetical protein Q664_48930 [Archangium violaceum Cb vi76]
MVPLRRLFLLLLLATCASACRGTRGDTRLFSLEDPRGDDHGDGELRYPLRQDMGPGSMDVLSFRAYAESGGTRFEAAFARPIPVPARRTMDAAGTTLADMARFGFYTFNLDVYVDEDGQEGSGRTDTLPGRYLTLAPGSAWEKVILLTPRPYEARDVLRALWRQEALAELQRQQGEVSESTARALETQVEQRIERSVFFPTRVRVSGPTVSFFVPESFLGGQARPTWGYAVAVTGATLERRVELPAILGAVTAPAQRGLMVLGIGPGTSHERFGGGRLGGTNQSPVVDLLVPEGVRQQEVLGLQARPWPAVVPASPGLPQAPDAGGTAGQGDAPAPSVPQR